MTTPFTPVLYVKTGCPHCFKLRLFLLEAGIIDSLTLKEFAPGDAGERAIRSELAPHFAKVTFPTVQYAAGMFENESDALVARYAAGAGIDPSTLPLHTTYAEVLLPRLQELKRENKRLHESLAEQQVS